MKLPATQLASLLQNECPKVDPACEAEVERLMDNIGDFPFLLSFECSDLNSSLSALTDMAAAMARFDGLTAQAYHMYPDAVRQSRNVPHSHVSLVLVWCVSPQL